MVGLENVSVWYDSCSPSEMVFFLLDYAPDSFYFFCYLHGKCYRQQESQRKIVSLLHCNMFSCLETSPTVLRTGCLSFSVNFPQHKTFRFISFPLDLGAHLTHRKVFLGSPYQVSQKFVPHTVDCSAEANMSEYCPEHLQC